MHVARFWGVAYQDAQVLAAGTRNGRASMKNSGETRDVARLVRARPAVMGVPPSEPRNRREW